jgi:hypothetical protein
MVVHTFHPSCAGGINRRSRSGQPGQKRETLLEKISKAKRAGGMAQVLEHLHNKPKALSSNTSATKKIQRFHILRSRSNIHLLPDEGI